MSRYVPLERAGSVVLAVATAHIARRRAVLEEAIIEALSACDGARVSHLRAELAQLEPEAG